MALLKNRFFLAFLGLYFLSVFILVSSGIYSLTEPLFLFAIFGLFFPGLAFFLCRGITPLPQKIKASGAEMLVLLGCLGLVVIYLIWGVGFLPWVFEEVLGVVLGRNEILRITEKLLIFVIIPLIIFSRGFGYSLADLGFSNKLKSAFSRKNLLIFIVFSFLFLGLQFLIGKAAQPLFNGEFSVSSVLFGALILYPILVLQVGLTEEFFFRALVQSRMAVWFKSEVTGLIIMALLFGLAHAPGLYLRDSGAVTILGTNPGLFETIAYTTVVLSLSAFVFGVIWAKTRNLYILILIHATVDLLPALPRFLEGLGMK